MKTNFYVFLGIVFFYIAQAIKVIHAFIVTPLSFKPVVSLIERIESQVANVKSIYDKKPCSMTGGTA